MVVFYGEEEFLSLIKACGWESTPSQLLLYIHSYHPYVPV
jgi:hypothetical protein